ncbi:MAG: dockerin type I repeat-containing protein [Phycisphaerales bacterium]
MRERGIDPTSDPAKWATEPGAWQGHRDQFCTDFEGNVAALVDSAGLVEQYRYSNSGVPHGLPLGDLNGDGEVDATTVDYNIWLNAKTTYEVRADLDLDGDVDASDGAIITAHNKNSTGRGRLSIATIREIYGWRQWEVFGEGLHTVWSNSQRSTADSGVSLELASTLKMNQAIEAACQDVLFNVGAYSAGALFGGASCHCPSCPPIGTPIVPFVMVGLPGQLRRNCRMGQACCKTACDAWCMCRTTMRHAPGECLLIGEGAFVVCMQRFCCRY